MTAALEMTRLVPRPPERSAVVVDGFDALRWLLWQSRTRSWACAPETLLGRDDEVSDADR